MSTYVSGLAVRSLVSLPHPIDSKDTEKYQGVLKLKNNGITADSFGLSNEEYKKFNPDPNAKYTFIPVKENTPTYYTVKQGDSLSEISEATGISVNDLALANGRNSKDYIFIGEKLIIPTKKPEVSLDQFTKSISDTFTPHKIPQTNLFTSRNTLTQAESIVPKTPEITTASISADDALPTPVANTGDFINDVASFAINKGNGFVNNLQLNHTFGETGITAGLSNVLVAGNPLADSLDSVVIGDRMVTGIFDDVSEAVEIDPRMSFEGDVEDDEIDSAWGLAWDFSNTVEDDLGNVQQMNTARFEVGTPYRGDLTSVAATFSMAHFTRVTPELSFSGSYVGGILTEGVDITTGDLIGDSLSAYASTTQAMQWGDQSFAATIGTEDGVTSWGNLAFNTNLGLVNLFALYEFSGLGGELSSQASLGADLEVGPGALSLAIGGDLAGVNQTAFTYGFDFE
jgi:LysM repeat protein